MGRETGLEPATTGITIRGSTNCSLRSHPISLREKDELTALLANMHDS